MVTNDVDIAISAMANFGHRTLIKNVAESLRYVFFLSIQLYTSLIVSTFLSELFEVVSELISFLSELSL